MKTRPTKMNVLLGAGVACLLATGTAFADADSDAMFKKLDSDSNGKISKQEMQKLPTLVHQKKFAEADTNNDGKVSEEEFRAQVKQRADRMFDRMDTDSDGSISAAESEAAHTGDNDHNDGHGMSGDRVFKHMNKNTDDSVSKSEWDTAVAAWEAKHGDQDDADQAKAKATSSTDDK